MKSRGVAILLALLLGGIGAHHFYLGNMGRGILFLLFCWTFVPLILACVAVVRYLLMSDKAFAKRYG